jgi:hypothetical protein
MAARDAPRPRAQAVSPRARAAARSYESGERRAAALANAKAADVAKAGTFAGPRRASARAAAMFASWAPMLQTLKARAMLPAHHHAPAALSCFSARRTARRPAPHLPRCRRAPRPLPRTPQRADAAAACAADARAQESAADLGATTNRAVAVGLDYTVSGAKSALAASGVADASLAAVALADRAVEASGVVGLTRAAVAATGRAIEATGRAAERSGAVDLTLRVSEATGAALAPALAASERALGAGLGATVAAADATLSGTLKVFDVTGRAAEALPQAVDLTGCVRWQPAEAHVAF